MAKFNIEVEIDWLEEGGNIDEQLKDEVKAGIINRIANTSIEDLKVKAAEIATAKVEEWINNFLDVQIETLKFPYGEKTDRFSKNPQEMLTIPEIVLKEFEKALNKTVDKEGRYSTSSYDCKGTRLEWLIGRAAEKVADEKTKAFVGDFYKNMNAYFTESLKSALNQQISSALLKQVDLNKVFQDK